MSDILPNVRQALKQANWDEITRRLLAFVAGVIYSKAWKGVRGGIPPGGIEPSDLVQQAIEKVLNGTRRWDPDHVSLLTCLMGVISSDLHSLAMSKENRNSRREHAHSGGESLDSNGFDLSQVAEDCSPSKLEESLIYTEYAKETECILAEFKDDNLAHSIVQLILRDDIYSPKVLANVLCINVQEVYNAKKRIRKRLEKIFCRMGKS